MPSKCSRSILSEGSEEPLRRTAGSAGNPPFFFNSRCELSCVRQTEDGREGGSPEDRSGFDRVVRSYADRERSERGRPNYKN